MYLHDLLVSDVVRSSLETGCERVRLIDVSMQHVCISCRVPAFCIYVHKTGQESNMVGDKKMRYK